MSVKQLFNTRKKQVIAGISSLVLLILIFASISLFPFLEMEDYFKGSGETGIDWKNDRIIEYAVIQCSFNLKNPEYVQIFETEYSTSENKYFDITFFKLSRSNIFSQKWDIKYNGYTSPKNTTFSQLADLVKEDCDQFKQGYPSTENPRKDNLPDEISWVWYEPPTEQEVKEQEEKQKEQDYADFLEEVFLRLNEEDREDYLTKIQNDEITIEEQAVEYFLEKGYVTQKELDKYK